MKTWAEIKMLNLLYHQGPLVFFRLLSDLIGPTLIRENNTLCQLILMLLSFRNTLIDTPWTFVSGQPMTQWSWAIKLTIILWLPTPPPTLPFPGYIQTLQYIQNSICKVFLIKQSNKISIVNLQPKLKNRILVMMWRKRAKEMLVKLNLLTTCSPLTNT